ncbi:MAG: TetR/AcrR family transcriptional regulator [Candidatus Eremiobacteraeota bacterium]|nr:TetR/AcrR family transcriptional regulator [Candidatus Eremiobacteraeota bacterium]
MRKQTRPVVTQRRGLDRRTEILKAAREVFLERGYAGASTDAIVDRSGGSKESLYSHFGNKLGLFRAVLLAEISRALEPDDGFAAEDPATMLRAVGRTFVRGFLHKDSVRLSRMVAAETERAPDLVRQHYQINADLWKARVADRLREYQASGRLAPGDVTDVAIAYHDLLSGHFIVRGLFEPEFRPSSADVDREVDWCVDLLLRLFAPQSQPKGAARRKAPKAKPKTKK